MCVFFSQAFPVHHRILAIISAYTNNEIRKCFSAVVGGQHIVKLPLKYTFRFISLVGYTLFLLLHIICKPFHFMQLITISGKKHVPSVKKPLKLINFM